MLFNAVAINFPISTFGQNFEKQLGKILKKVEIGKFIATALKSILKLVKLQSLVAKRCKMWEM